MTEYLACIVFSIISAFILKICLLFTKGSFIRVPGWKFVTLIVSDLHLPSGGTVLAFILVILIIVGFFCFFFPFLCSATLSCTTGNSMLRGCYIRLIAYLGLFFLKRRMWKEKSIQTPSELLWFIFQYLTEASNAYWPYFYIFVSTLICHFM